MGFHITREDLDSIAYVLGKADESTLVIEQVRHGEKTFFLGFDPNTQRHFLRGINDIKFDKPEKVTRGTGGPFGPSTR